MTDTLSILIADTDRYFSYGLSLGLKTFFLSHNQDIKLIEEDNVQDHIDIVFLGNSVTCPPWLYHLHQKKCYPPVFFIKDKGRDRDTLKSQTARSECGAGTLYRHQDISALYRLLDGVLQPQEKACSLLRPNQCPCISLLTPREVDVLQRLTLGMSGRNIAAQLRISEKTVNAHKQSAMRKLNFRRNQELYRWLLQGGARYLNGSQHLSLSPLEIFETSPLHLKGAEKMSSSAPVQRGVAKQNSLLLRRRRSTTYDTGAYIAWAK